MKRLYLMRHAEAGWDGGPLGDFGRQLTEHGIDAAATAGRRLAEHGRPPETIVSSPAARTKATAELVKESAGLAADIRTDARVYEASAEELVRVASEIDDRAAAAMIVGHNPGMEDLIRYLTGRIEPMPTAAAAVIDLEIASWGRIGPLAGTVVRVIRP